MQISSQSLCFCILMKLRRSCLHRFLMSSASALGFFRLFLYERSICTNSLDPHTSLIHTVPGLGWALIPYGVRGGAAIHVRQRLQGFCWACPHSVLRGTSVIAFTTGGIARAGDPLLSVITNVLYSKGNVRIGFRHPYLTVISVGI